MVPLILAAIFLSTVSIAEIKGAEDQIADDIFYENKSQIEAVRHQLENELFEWIKVEKRSPAEIQQKIDSYQETYKNLWINSISEVMSKHIITLQEMIDHIVNNEMPSAFLRLDNLEEITPE